jgi:hypothetical protein
MNTHRAGQPVIHRGHLCLVAPVVPEIRLSRREVRTMLRVAALIRRRAARLPKDSLLRAELMDAAEYYATGADQAAGVTRATGMTRLDLRESSANARSAAGGLTSWPSRP